MGQRHRDHRVLNVYGSEAVEAVENAIAAAQSDGAETESEAIQEVASAYTGWDGSR